MLIFPAWPFYLQYLCLVSSSRTEYFCKSKKQKRKVVMVTHGHRNPDVRTPGSITTTEKNRMPLTEGPQEFITQTFHQERCRYIWYFLEADKLDKLFNQVTFSPMIRPNVLQRDAKNILCNYGNLWNVLETWRMQFCNVLLRALCCPKILFIKIH